MNKQYPDGLLSKERAFLFLSIVIIITLLTGFPENLKVFVLGTTGTITGGVTAVQPVELKDYLIGLVIFAGLLIFLGYLVHALRTPKPEAWYPQVAEEGDMDNLDRVNHQLKNLRAAKEDAPKRKAKKVTRVPDMREISLEHALRKVNAQLHGYTKPPLVLEAPQEKGKWDDHLEQIKQELVGVEKMKFKKAKIREEMPSEKDIALQHESKKIQEELKQALAKSKNSRPITILEEPSAKRQWNEHLEKVKWQLDNVDKMPLKKVKVLKKIPLITKTNGTLEQQQLGRELQKLHRTLEEEKRNTPNYNLKRYVPSSREWQLAKIKRHIQKKGAVKNKEELAEIEQKLAKMYREN